MSEFDKPFRITVEHYDSKYVIEKDRSDVDYDEYVEMLNAITASVGFRPSLDDYYLKGKERSED